MTKNVYEKFVSDELILRDELAIDRTLLANERTLLAYLRSAMSLVLVGITFIHLFETGIVVYVGIFCIPFGLLVGVFGMKRYRRMDKDLSILRK